MRRCVLTLLAGLLASALPVLVAQETELPKGREVVANGQFDQSTTGPVSWMTRDSGSLGAFKLVPGVKDKTPASLLVECTKTCPRPWYLELRQRISDPLQKGERLFISFEYKVSKDYVFHFYWQKETAPWPKMLSLRLAEPVNTWDKVQVAVPVDEDLPAGASSLTFHLAEALGKVELRNIHAIAVSPRVDPASLPSTVEPVFGGDFYDNDWRNAALHRIAEVRQSPVRVLVYQDKKPVPNAKIRLVQVSRPFSVGVEAKAPLLVDGGLDVPQLQPLGERLGDARTALPAYRKKVFEAGLFDALTLEAGLMWREHDAWGKDLAKPALELAKAHGMAIQGHAMLCPAFEFLPDPADYRQMDAEALTNRLLYHVRSMATTYADLVDRWEVLFGPLAYDEVYDKTGVDLLPASFRTARRQLPKTPLFLADARGLMEPTPNHISETVELVQWLRLEQAPVDGLVLNARLTQPYTAPQAMDERVSLVGQELPGSPVYIASLELDVAREEAQAHMLRDLLISFFSQANVAGVSFSDIWEAEAPKPSAALYRRDMSPKPSGTMLEELFGRTWRTDEELKTDEHGTAWVRAFHGTYRVAVTVGKTTTEGTVAVTAGGNDIVVRIGAQEDPVTARELTAKHVPDEVKVAPVKASWQTPLEGVDGLQNGAQPNAIVADPAGPVEAPAQPDEAQPADAPAEPKEKPEAKPKARPRPRNKAAKDAPAAEPEAGDKEPAKAE